MPARSVSISTNQQAGESQTLIRLKDSSAPATYEFALDLPAGSNLVATGDGGFDVTTRIGPGVAMSIAHIDAPWARDATGRARATTFSLRGSTLVQRVDTHGAVYPITADPKFTWGWVTGTIYFNKAETSLLRSGTGAVGFLSRFVPGWGALIAAYATTFGIVAGIAVYEGKCMKVKLPSLRFQIYSGGYCR